MTFDVMNVQKFKLTLLETTIFIATGMFFKVNNSKMETI